MQKQSSYKTGAAPKSLGEENNYHKDVKVYKVFAIKLYYKP